MNPHAENVLCMLLTHDDRHLITGSSDSTARVTDLETNKVIRTFGGRSGMVRALALSSHSEYLVTGKNCTVIIIFAIATVFYFRSVRFYGSSLEYGQRRNVNPTRRFNGASFEFGIDLQ